MHGIRGVLCKVLRGSVTRVVYAKPYAGSIRKALRSGSDDGGDDDDDGCDDDDDLLLMLMKMMVMMICCCC